MFGVLITLTAYGTLYSHDMPPSRYRGDVQVTVRFESESKVESDCGVGIAPAPAGQHYAGCNLPDGIMVLPNACLRPAESDFRLTLCHEIGHANGWPPDHPAR